jgi:hypothetical protein
MCSLKNELSISHECLNISLNQDSKGIIQLGHLGSGYNCYIKSISGVRKIFKWDGTFLDDDINI